MTSQLSIEENVPLAPFTTLRIGGPARFFVEAHNEDDLPSALAFAEQRHLPVFILGGGSNVLIADEGFPGLVIRIVINGIQWRNEGKSVLVTAGAGEDWDKFVRESVERDLAGIECLSGIPGLIGGTPIQNVGAYGQEVSETIVTVRVYDRHTKKIAELSNADCGFSYRSSLFNTTTRDRYIVMSVTYALNPRGEPAICYPDVQEFFGNRRPSLKEVREAVRTIRSRKAMLLTPDDPDCRSAGSFFKNPIITRELFEQIEDDAKTHGLIRGDERVPSFSTDEGRVKVPAAWLIERSGFRKGFSRGRVGISTKHTLAIINRGDATSHEVLDLVKEIRERVSEKFGVSLQPEPVFIGLPSNSR